MFINVFCIIANILMPLITIIIPCVQTIQSKSEDDGIITGINLIIISMITLIPIFIGMTVMLILCIELLIGGILNIAIGIIKHIKSKKHNRTNNQQIM